MRSVPAGHSSRIQKLTHIDPWFLAQLEDLVLEEQQVAERGMSGLSAERLRGLKRKGFSDSRLAHLVGVVEKAVRQRRHELGIRPGVQARGHLRRGIRDLDRLHVLHLRGGVRGRAHRPAQDHDPGRRTEPHRPGHRVRLLLRARGARAARGWFRDHHGQLQSGDRLHRLRHLRPAVLRAADARGRAGDPGEGEARRASSCSSAVRRR